MFLVHFFLLFAAQNTHMHIGIDRNHFDWQTATMAYEKKKRERISKSRRKKSNCILYVSRRVTSTAAAAIASNASIVFYVLFFVFSLCFRSDPDIGRESSIGNNAANNTDSSMLPFNLSIFLFYGCTFSLFCFVVFFFLYYFIYTLRFTPLCLILDEMVWNIKFKKAYRNREKDVSNTFRIWL